MALAVREWLPLIVPSVAPWVSSEDIAKGTRGRDAIVRELAGTGQGVICLTKENVREPWLNFEAGALSNHPEKPRVRTVLFDLKVSDVVGPLSDFQHTDLNDQEDVWKLVVSINDESEPKLAETQLRTYFDSFWDRLVKRLDAIRQAQAQQRLPASDDSDAAIPRTPEQVMEEVLERIRTVERRQRMLSGGIVTVQRIVEGIAENVGSSPPRSKPETEDEPPSPPVRYVATTSRGIGEVESIGEEGIIAHFENGDRVRFRPQSVRLLRTRESAERYLRDLQEKARASDSSDEEPPF